jgi:short-subunit dehydrogenase involved in D-alanine esterification of teichoic acids
LDVANPESVLKLKEWLIKENIKLDVLVNNAGIAKNHKDIIDINVLGTINISEQLLPTLTPDGKVIILYY